VYKHYGCIQVDTVLGHNHFRTGEKIWEFSDNPDTILISSCTTVEVMSDGELVRGSDCINGTKMPNSFFEEYTNFTHLMNVFHVSNLTPGRYVLSPLPG
jgi:hypothetical protein